MKSDADQRARDELAKDPELRGRVEAFGDLAREVPPDVRQRCHALADECDGRLAKLEERTKAPALSSDQLMAKYSPLGAMGRGEKANRDGLPKSPAGDARHAAIVAEGSPLAGAPGDLDAAWLRGWDTVEARKTGPKGAAIGAMIAAVLEPAPVFIDAELPPESPGSKKPLVSFWRDIDDDSERSTWVWQVRYPNGHVSKYTATTMQLIQALKDAAGNPDRRVSVEVLEQGKSADQMAREDLAADPGGDGGIGSEVARRRKADDSMGAAAVLKAIKMSEQRELETMLEVRADRLAVEDHDDPEPGDLPSYPPGD